MHLLGRLRSLKAHGLRGDRSAGSHSIAKIIAAALCIAAGSALIVAQPPPKEYIRLGGRVIAIENNLAISADHFGSSGGTGMITISFAGNWTAAVSSSTSFIHITSATSGSGSGQVNFSVEANCFMSSRMDTITAAGHVFTVTQDAAVAVCNPGGGTTVPADPVTPTYLEFNANGTPATGTPATSNGMSAILSSNPNVPANAAWSFSNPSNLTWIHVSPVSGTGPFTLTVTADPNGAILRTGTIIVFNVTITVTQQGSAVVQITPQSAVMPDSSANGSLYGSISVSTANSVNWSSNSDSPWLHISQGSSGTGNGSVSYYVDQNIAATPRTGTITISSGAGNQKCTITQQSATPAITVIPSTVLLATNQTKQFAASCTPCTGTIQWSLATSTPWGSIASDGTYTAPNSVPPGPVTVIAKNGSFTGSATVTVGSLTAGATYSISPANSGSQPGQATTFTVLYRFPNSVFSTEFAFIDFMITANPSSGGGEPANDHSCLLEWVQTGNYPFLRLYNDAGQLASPPSGTYQFTSTSPPAGTKLWNSQCTILVDQFTYAYGGGTVQTGVTSVSFNAPIVFNPVFGGVKSMWSDVSRSDGSTSVAWSSFGTWTVPGYQPPDLSIDPLPATVSGTVAITGWALDNKAEVESAINSVKVFLDGNPLPGSATLGQPSTVCNTYPLRAGCPNVGFSYSWDTTGFPNGTHTIRVDATDSDAIPLTNSSQVVVTVSNNIAVSLQPATAQLIAGQQATLTAAVTGTSTARAGVGWSLTPNIGTLTSDTATNTATHTAIYTAPNTLNAMATVTVTATSIADPTKNASATITLIPADMNLTNPVVNSGTSTYQATNTITATGGTISGTANVTFIAGTVIKLEPEFRATASGTGVTFHVVIGH